MKTTTIKQIQSVNTLNDYLTVLQNNFNCEACKIGLLVRHTLINTLLNKLSGTNVIVNQNLKNKAVQAETVKQFIDIVKENFNTSGLFTESAKRNLVNDTETLLLLTRLKEKDEKAATTEEKKKRITPRNPK